MTVSHDKSTCTTDAKEGLKQKGTTVTYRETPEKCQTKSDWRYITKKPIKPLRVKTPQAKSFYVPVCHHQPLKLLGCQVVG